MTDNQPGQPGEDDLAALMRIAGGGKADKYTRTGAINLLASRGADDDRTLPLLLRLVEEEPPGYSEVRQAAVRAIAEGWAEDPWCCLMLRDWAARGMSDALRALSREPLRSRYYPFAYQLWTSDPDPRIRRTVEDVLRGGMSPPGVTGEFRGSPAAPLTEAEWARAERAALACYQLTGRPVPRTVLRVPSPLAGCMVLIAGSGRLPAGLANVSLNPSEWKRLSRRFRRIRHRRTLRWRSAHLLKKLGPFSVVWLGMAGLTYHAGTVHPGNYRIYELWALLLFVAVAALIYEQPIGDVPARGLGVALFDPVTEIRRDLPRPSSRDQGQAHGPVIPPCMPPEPVPWVYPPFLARRGYGHTMPSALLSHYQHPAVAGFVPDIEARELLRRYPWNSEPDGRPAGLSTVLADLCLAGRVWFAPELCVIVDRPHIASELLEGADDADGRGPDRRLHCAAGPAVTWSDGTSRSYWHGLEVPPKLINPGWTARRILAERNVEVRRAAIESMGWDRFVRKARLRPVGEPAPDPGNPGQTLRLYRAPRRLGGAEVRILLCTDGTPGRDGVRRSYGLIVPASAADPVEAAAWTYDLSRDAYLSVERRS